MNKNGKNYVSIETFIFSRVKKTRLFAWNRTSQKRNWAFTAKGNFLIRISLQPDDVSA